MIKDIKQKNLYSFTTTIFLGLIFSVIFQKVISKIEWPAFNSSNVTPTLTTAVCIVCILVFGFLYLKSKNYSQKILQPIFAIFLSIFATGLMAIPLGSTKLFYMGISIDQQFRTEYLTRFADSASLADMTYSDMPPFYPPAWFWVGGRLANFLDIPAWEFYKPYSITSLIVVLLFSCWLWSLILDFRKNILVSIASTITIIQFNAFEPYGAIIALVIIPTLIFFYRALNENNKKYLLFTGIILGVSAITYTLYTFIFCVALFFILLSYAHTTWYAETKNSRQIKIFYPLIKNIFVTIIPAILISSISWMPYFYRLFTSNHESSKLASRFLPSNSTELFFPFFDFNFWGIISWVGLFWLIFNFSKNIIAKTISLFLLATYFWSLLSMLATLFQTTLLGFRTEPLIYLGFAISGFLGIQQLIKQFKGNSDFFAKGISITLLLLVMGMSQNIPNNISQNIISAYQDTDGYGERGDKRPPGAEKYYPEINNYILKTTKKPANQSTVLTTDYSFLSIYPYWGFQNLTPHYANPLAQFNYRNNLIIEMSKITKSSDLQTYLNNLSVTKPNVFIFRITEKGYTLRLSEDRYPNDPNVKRFYITFPKNLFLNQYYAYSHIGPFAIFIAKY